MGHRWSIKCHVSCYPETPWTSLYIPIAPHLQLRLVQEVVQVVRVQMRVVVQAGVTCAAGEEDGLHPGRREGSLLSTKGPPQPLWRTQHMLYNHSPLVACSPSPSARRW